MPGLVSLTYWVSSAMAGLLTENDGMAGELRRSNGGCKEVRQVHGQDRVLD